MNFFVYRKESGWVAEKEGEIQAVSQYGIYWYWLRDGKMLSLSDSEALENRVDHLLALEATGM